MRSTLTPADIHPDQTYVCAFGFAAPEGVVAGNQRLAGTDPRVKLYPQYFVADGTLPEDVPSPIDQVIAESEKRERAEREAREAAFARAARANRVRFDAPRLARATKDFQAEVDNRPATVAKGSVLEVQHPLVLEHPDCWTPDESGGSSRKWASRLVGAVETTSDDSWAVK